MNRTLPPDGPPWPVPSAPAPTASTRRKPPQSSSSATHPGSAGDDFRNGFVDIGASITDDGTFIAAIDWSAVITALDECGLPATGGERRYSGLPRAWPTALPATYVTHSPEWTVPVFDRARRRCAPMRPPHTRQAAARGPARRVTTGRMQQARSRSVRLAQH
jgi:hypothetical protein